MMLFRTLFCRPIWGNPLENVLGIWGFHKPDGSIYTENIENLILFVPFVLLYFWMREEKEHNKKKPLQAALMRSVSVSFGFSLLIELCQLFLKIGTFQLTDLFLTRWEVFWEVSSTGDLTAAGSVRRNMCDG